MFKINKYWRSISIEEKVILLKKIYGKDVLKKGLFVTNKIKTEVYSLKTIKCKEKT